MKPAMIRPADLEKFIEGLYLKQGLLSEHAKIGAWHTTLAEKWGVKTHGINLLEWYVASIKRDSVKAKPTIQLTSKGEIASQLDAGRAHGQVATYLAAEEAIRLIKKNKKAGVVGVVNSNHFGMAGAPAYHIAQAGYIGLVISSTPPIIAPVGATQKAVGSNPLAFSFPLTGREPVILDFSLSVAALNKIVIAKREKKPVPGNAYLNRKGQFTTSPEEILDYKLAAPLGGLAETSGHKGFGLAFMCELLAACILGGKTSAELFSWNRDVQGVAAESHMVIALPVDAFREKTDVERSVVDLISFVKARERMEGVSEILVPGDDRSRNKERSEKEGIDLTDWQAEILMTLSKAHDVELNLRAYEHV